MSSLVRGWTHLVSYSGSSVSVLTYNETYRFEPDRMVDGKVHEVKIGDKTYTIAKFPRVVCESQVGPVLIPQYEGRGFSSGDGCMSNPNVARFDVLCSPNEIFVLYDSVHDEMFVHTAFETLAVRSCNASQ